MKHIIIYINSIDFKNILALIITLSWVSIHMYCVATNCNINKDLAVDLNIIQAMVIGYYFGSSYSSNKKDKMLQTANEQLGIKKCKEEHE